MRILKKAQFPINSITLLVILLVFIDTIVTREIENEAIRDSNLHYSKLRTRGQDLKAYARPPTLSTAANFGKRKDNLVTLRNIHLERQSRRYQLHWLLELAQRYPIVARNYQWRVLNGNDNGHSSNRQVSESIKIP